MDLPPVWGRANAALTGTMAPAPAAQAAAPRPRPSNSDEVDSEDDIELDAFGRVIEKRARGCEREERARAGKTLLANHMATDRIL